MVRWHTSHGDTGSDQRLQTVLCSLTSRCVAKLNAVDTRKSTIGREKNYDKNVCHAVSIFIYLMAKRFERLAER